jgi:uncharacterized membrane protein YidH (DUF202 family)
MLFLTDRLAVTRTALANERMLAAYGRTSLALAAAGPRLTTPRSGHPPGTDLC